MIKDNQDGPEFGTEKIKEAVLQLSPSDSVSFRDLFHEFDANARDEQFELDVGEGRLDVLADEALDEARLGHSTELRGSARRRDSGVAMRGCRIRCGDRQISAMGYFVRIPVIPPRD
jgi:hypothetical protein